VATEAKPNEVFRSVMPKAFDQTEDKDFLDNTFDEAEHG
jgi:hypothetical protein